MNKIDFKLATRAIGVVIRVERTRRRWTAAELARKVNVTRAAVCAWEKGISPPSFKRMLALGSALKQPVSSIMQAAERVETVMTARQESES
jgi:transcriptional regulator with XRE-family HTH domain